eukprot:gene25354-33892_t
MMLDVNKLPMWERFVIQEDENLSNETKILSSGEEVSTVQLLEFLRKLSQRSLEKTEKIYNQIFTLSPVERAKHIAKSYAEEIMSSTSLKNQLPSLTYGEIEFFSFWNIVQRCCPSKGDVFVDLGHGTGRALIAAALLFGSEFSKIYGVELIPGLYNESIANVLNYQEFVKDRSHIFPTYPDVVAEQGDFLAIEDGISSASSVPSLSSWLRAADIVFINSTCFGEEIMCALGRKLSVSLRPGSRVACLTFRLPVEESGSNGARVAASFELLHTLQLSMSWGLATCYIYQKS